MNVLIVCTGNTCRSPMAAFLMQEAADSRGLDLTVRSAGISATLGHPISRGTAEQLRAHVTSPDHMSRTEIFIENHTAGPLDADLIAWADLILTMTTGHAAILTELYPDAHAKVMTLWGAADPSRADFDVTDPFGGDPEVYAATYEELTDLISKFMDRL